MLLAVLAKVEICVGVTLDLSLNRTVALVSKAILGS